MLRNTLIRHNDLLVFVTGGMTPERIPSAIEAGAVLIGTGFEVTLQDHEKDITSDEVTQVMRQYLTIVHCARTQHYPQMIAASHQSKETWLQTLPHYHPFGCRSANHVD